ncbi:MAG: hypothetical protein ACREBT_01650 [Thermoplasmata archaeon]
MSLFSDMDWVIIVAVGVFLLFGSNNAGVMRTIGRYYAQAMRMKQTLMSEVTRAAELPTPSPGQSFSLRTALLSGASLETTSSSVPPLRSPSSAPLPPPSYRPAVPSDLPWTGATPTPTWSIALPAVPTDVERVR